MKKIFFAPALIWLCIMGSVANAQSEISTIPTYCPSVVRHLAFGSRGPDVVQLQEYLISQNMLAPGFATGYFGFLTERAVQRWQVKYDIVYSGTPATTGYGVLGPKTRSKMFKCSPAVLPPSCTPLTTQTQDISCPMGQVGSITQNRTSSCPGPTWSAWATIANTCTIPQSPPTKTIINGAIDPVTWLNTTKGEGSVRGFSEVWDASRQTWVNGTGVAQPFKMYADRSVSQIYWRKDMPAVSQRQDGKNYEYFGEIFTFDNTSVRLREESFPIFLCPGVGGRCDAASAPWDIRADKFRLFAVATGAPLKQTQGRFFMPRPMWHGWSNGPHDVNTYYCASYSELQQSTCPIYQQGIKDWITIEAYSNYDIFNADGDKVIAMPGGTPTQRIYDVVIVTQEQNITNLSESVAPGVARGNYRERYFFGRVGNDYYGFIRWDGSKNVNGAYELEYRTIGYGWDTTFNPTFTEMQQRGAQGR